MAYIGLCTNNKKKSKNTGASDQCLESRLKLPVLSNGFKFPDVKAFKNVDVWKAAIASKSLVPLYDVFELADASTEDTKYETGSFSRVVEKGVEKITFECYLSPCSYEALKSYEDTEYDELFEFNAEGDYSGVFDKDGKSVRGRKITNLNVTRMRATKEKVPYVKVEITFQDKDDVLDQVIVSGDLTKEDLEGIYDINIDVIESTMTSLKFKVTSGCAGGTEVNTLTTDDLEVRLADGTLYPTSFINPIDSIYEMTGAEFVSGMELHSKGTGPVIVHSNAMYEAEPVSLTIPSN
ncbi:hypothetical protein BTO06_09805 [Tenacibaculum sp. SZ-18]|uniref:hypothetical protein n=1 Tax=Tenacibaculum sp. SZ-18 TaxID=754423 RepID=UPI000C2D26D4|nr:hypothetical protein [Tenacibaculum sp. SZ-18]AUC15414.1 hypothetical protein BTO06_09805 [Tenacibaculum sp. SZ-18]